jgi:hypothetical protein
MDAIITKEPKWNKTETDDWQGCYCVTETAWFSKPVSIREFAAAGWTFTDCRCGPSSWYKTTESTDDRCVTYRIYQRDRWNKYGKVERQTITRSTTTVCTRQFAS